MIAWASAGQGRQNGHLPPALKLGLGTKYFWKNLKWVSHFRLIDVILAMTVFCLYETYTAQESGSQL